MRDLAHHLVLRLVADARLPPPRRDQQRRYAKGRVEGCQRIDRVAETRILAHDHRVSPGEPGAGSDCDRLAFVCPADIGERRAVEYAIDQRRQETAGHAGIEVKVVTGGRSEELRSAYHYRSLTSNCG